MEKKLSKRIVIITEYFYPRIRTDAILVTDIAQKISSINKGDIRIICTSTLEENEELQEFKNKIIRLKNSKLNDANIILRIIKFLILTSRLVLNTIKTVKKDDIIFSTTNPIFLVPILIILKKIFGFKYVLLVYDLFPNNLIAANLIKKDKFFYKIIDKIYKWSYSNTDQLIVIGRDMKEVLKSKINNDVKIDIIENWCDVENIISIPKEKNKILNKYNIANKKVFVFVGNLGRVQGIETLLKATLLVKDKNFVLLFIGDGTMKNRIIKFIKQYNTKKVIYAGSYPLDMKNEFLNACDVHIISLSKSMYGLGVPSKTYCNMAASKPLLYIGDNNSEIALMIKEHEIGWCVETNNAIMLANQLDNICINFNNINLIGKRARNIVKYHYNKDIILKKYEKIFNSKVL